MPASARSACASPSPFQTLFLRVGIAVLCLVVLFDLFSDFHRRSLANDYTSIWISAKVLLSGKNPYADLPAVYAIYDPLRTAYHIDSPDTTWVMTAYPPSALALLAPLSLFSYPAANLCMMLLSLLALLAAVFLLARHLRRLLPDQGVGLRVASFAAFALALVPFHSGLHNANPAVLVIACLTLCLLWFSSRPVSAGIALAVAIALKPQIGVLFLLYPCLRGKLKLLSSAIVALSVLFLVPTIWLGLHGVYWFQAYLDSMRYFVTAGRSGGAAVDNLSRFFFINLRVPLFELTHNPALSSWIAIGAFLLLAAPAAYRIRTHFTDRDDIQGFAITGTLMLLPMYHRLYDSGVFLFVLLWAILYCNRRAARIVLLLLAPLLVPLVSVFYALRNRPAMAHLTSTTLFAGFVLPYVSWICLALAVLQVRELFHTHSANLSAREASQNRAANPA